MTIVRVAPEYRRYVSGERFIGQCYEKALEYVVKHRDIHALRLVHGTIEPPGHPRLKHAWVTMPQGVVFDGVDQQFYRGSAYRRALAAIAEAAYDVRQVAHFCLNTNNAGPWHQPAYEAIVRVSQSPLFRVA